MAELNGDLYVSRPPVVPLSTGASLGAEKLKLLARALSLTLFPCRLKGDA